jgi:murein L,D-transpeptidase YafK
VVIGLLSLTIYLLYPYSPMPADVKIEKLVVDKSDRKLMVLSKGEIIKTYTISLGNIPVGHKQKG